MNRIRIRRRRSVRTTATALAVAAAAACADGAAARDCGPSPVRADIEGEPLTQAERIARLDEALNESLARFDECQNDVPAAVEQDTATETAGGGPASANGDAAGAGSDRNGGNARAAGDGTRGNGSAATAAGDGAGGNARPGTPARDGDGVESAAARGVEGTQDSGDGAATRPEGGVESVAAEGVQGTQPPEDGTGTTSGSPRPEGSGGTPGDDAGAIPDDIPRGDNDSVLEAQIRRAAMEETDPRVRAELWNEYRKYKGLPVKPLPEDDGDPSDAETSQ